MPLSPEDQSWAEEGVEIMRFFGERPHHWQGKKVLELGACRCLIGRALQDHDVECLCVDRRSYEGMEHLDPWELKEFQSLVPFLEADARNLPLPDNSYDLVVSYEGPPAVGPRSMRDIRAMIGEVRRVLRPGGRFLMSPPGLVTKYMVPLHLDDERKFSNEAFISHFTNIQETSTRLLADLLPGMKIIKRKQMGFEYLDWKKSRKGLAALLRAEKAEHAAREVA